MAEEEGLPSNEEPDVLHENGSADSNENGIV